MGHGAPRAMVRRARRPSLPACSLLPAFSPEAESHLEIPVYLASLPLPFSPVCTAVPLLGWSGQVEARRLGSHLLSSCFSWDLPEPPCPSCVAAYLSGCCQGSFLCLRASCKRLQDWRDS